MLHETLSNSQKIIEQATINCHSVKSHTLLQVIPVTISNGSRTITINAFLNSGSDSTLISKNLADKLNLKGATEKLKIRNLLNNEVS